jgi:hypothetical protein
LDGNYPGRAHTPQGSTGISMLLKAPSIRCRLHIPQGGRSRDMYNCSESARSRLPDR